MQVKTCTFGGHFHGDVYMMYVYGYVECTRICIRIHIVYVYVYVCVYVYLYVSVYVCVCIYIECSSQLSEQERCMRPQHCSVSIVGLYAVGYAVP